MAVQPEDNPTISFADGTPVPGTGPVVIIGPNGSGKTRQVRTLQFHRPIDFINATRNTRIQAQLAPLAPAQATVNYENQRNTRRQNYWDLTNEFDFLLSKIHAELAASAIRYMAAAESGAVPAEPETVLAKVARVWSDLFPGRKLVTDEVSPKVTNDLRVIPRGLFSTGDQATTGFPMISARRVFCEGH